MQNIILNIIGTIEFKSCLEGIPHENIVAKDLPPLVVRDDSPGTYGANRLGC